MPLAPSQKSAALRDGRQDAVRQSAGFRLQVSNASEQDDDAAELHEAQEVVSVVLVARHETSEVRKP